MFKRIDAFGLIFRLETHPEWAFAILLHKNGIEFGFWYLGFEIEWGQQ